MPHYNRRADLVCFVNGLPLVFIELKAVYRNIRAGFDDNLTDYLTEHSIAHAFHHNAFLVVSNGDQARYGSITSKWEHFVEWKRNAETDKARLDAEALLDGMLAKERLLDLVENFILFDDSRAGGHAQGRGAQPPGARREQRRRVGPAAGGAEAAVPAGRAPDRIPRADARAAARPPSRRRRRQSMPVGFGRGARATGLAAAQAGAPGPRAARASSGTRRAAASPTRWPSSPRRCAGSCPATSPSW